MLSAWRHELSAYLTRWARPRSPETLPLRILRNRIYVLPTGFGLFLAALLGAMAVGALNYNNNPALLLALLLGAVGLASLITAHLQLAGLQVEMLSAEPVPAGSSLRLRISLRIRDTRTRRGLQLDYGDAHTFVSLSPEGTVEADLPLATTQRGWLPLERIRISTTQPLGLARAWCWVWPDHDLLVYPKPELQGPPLPEGAGNSAQARLHPMGDDLHHLRPYRAGDPQRAIAWKHSARRDLLLVREMEQPQGAEVVFDWLQLQGLGHEQRIARLARWVDEAERDGRRYRLLLPAQPVLGPDHGPSHRHLCLRALALMPYG